MTDTPPNPGAAATKAHADAHALSLMPVLNEAMTTGVRDLTGLAAYLNGHGIPTARGGKWEPRGLSNVMSRLVAIGHAEFKVRSRSRAQLDRQQARRQREALVRAKIAARKKQLVFSGILPPTALPAFANTQK